MRRDCSGKTTTSSWRILLVMSRGPDERSQMQAMSLLLSTCEGMTNRVFIDEGAKWILQGERARTTRPDSWCQSWDQYLRTTVDSCSRQPTPTEIGAVVSTCACCGNAGHEKAMCRFSNAKCSNCGKAGHLKAMCRQREKSAGKSSPSSSRQEFWQRRHEPWKHRRVLLLWTGRSSTT